MTRERYRVGSKAGVTVWRYDADEPADDRGHRPSDHLLCMATSSQGAYAIVAGMNRRSLALEAEADR